MIESTASIYDPQIEISTDLSITVQSISDNPQDSSEFERWLAAKAVEVGTGKQQEYYSEEDNDIEVNFTVVMRSLSIQRPTK